MRKKVRVVELGRHDTSDGYHTFDELYDHRIALFFALMRSHPQISWRANNHADGTGYDNFFICGMELPSGQVTYHVPNERWIELDNYGISTYSRAPHWDGHSPQDVVDRLNEWRP